MADGRLTFVTALDNKQLEKDYQSTKKKVQSLEEQIYKKKQEKLPLEEKVARLAPELRKAEQELSKLQSKMMSIDLALSPEGVGNPAEYLDALGQKESTAAEIEKQKQKVQELSTEFEKAASAVEKLDAKIEESTTELDRAKQEAGICAQELAKASQNASGVDKNTRKSSKAMEEMGKRTQKFGNRLKSIVAGALVFNVISAGLRGMTDWFGKVIKSNDKARAAMAKLKGALLTLAQPIIEIVIPAFISLVNVLSKIVSAIASLVAKLFGKTVEGAASSAEALYKEADALDGVANSSKKAAKNLTGLDEISTWQSDPESSASSSDTIAPDFNLGESTGIFKLIEDNLLEIIALIGGLKLGSFIADLLTANVKATTLKDTFKLLGKRTLLTIGIALAITGLVMEWDGIIDSIKNGLNGMNFTEILGGGGMIVSGGAMIGKFLGSGIIGGAIGGIVAGIPMVFAGIWDACVNGLNWLNGLLIPAGTAVAGAGIGALIGSVGGPLGALIGLAVGALIDLIILIVQEWDVIADWFGDVFSAIGQFFVDLWDGIVEIWNVVAEWFNEYVIQPVAGFFVGLWDGIVGLANDCWEGIKNIFSAVGNWFNDYVIQPVAGFFVDLWDGFKNGASKAWEGVKSVFSKVAEFFKNIFSKAWEGILSIFSVAGDIFVGIKDAIVTAFKFVVNGIIKGLNSVIKLPFEGINGILDILYGISILGVQPFSWLTWRLPVPQIPLLAQGAVIPPNREFLAVLGDQKHGTNIEAPLDTIKQAVAEVLAGSGGGRNSYTVNATANGRPLFQLILEEGRAERTRTGLNPFDLR